MQPMYRPHDPHQAPTPCWYCTAWDGVDSSGVHALCAHQNTSRVRSQPVNGCSSFEREPGVDDDAWAPLLEITEAGKSPAARKKPGTRPG